MNRTDSRIIEHLIHNKEDTILSIGKSLGMARKTVWKHINFLTKTGLIEKNESKYCLTTNYFEVVGDFITSLNRIFEHFEKDPITDEGILLLISYIIDHTTFRNGNNGRE